MPRLLLSLAVLALGAAACASDEPSGRYGGAGMATDAAYGQAKVPPMAEGRTIDEEDCTQPLKLPGGNLRCK